MAVSEQPFTDLLSAIVDNRGRTCPTAERGISLIATNCIKNDALYPVKEKVRYVDGETYATWFRGHPISGDILFVCKGTPGSVAMVPDPVDFCIAQDMVAVRADPSKVYPNYLFAALRSPRVQEQISSMHVGTMIPHFKKGDFDKLMIPLRDWGEQEFIGDFYVQLSMKIESTRRLCALLDKLLRVIVDAATESGLTERRRLGDLVERVNEQVRPDPSAKPSIYIGLEHMPRGRVFLDSWGTSRSVTSAKARFILGDILFGKLRPYFKKVGIAPVAGLCSTDVLVLRPRNDLYRGVVLAESASDGAIDYATGGSTGTRMPRVSWEYLAAWEVAVPTGQALIELAAITSPIVDEGIALVHQEQGLIALRDALLLDLLSGRLPVPDGRDLAEAL